MVDLVLTLVDYLIKFLQKRDDNADEYFESYVSPTFEAAQTVFNDYLTILFELREKIIKKEKPAVLINFLEKERNRYLSSRMRLRAEIASRFNNDYAKDELPRFEKGILGILMGGIATLEDDEKVYSPYGDKYHGLDVNDRKEYLIGNHTLLALLNNFSFYKSIGWDYTNYLKSTEKQINILHLAWKDVVDGYAEYKKIVTPTPSNKIFRKRVQSDLSASELEKESAILELKPIKTISKTTKSVSKVVDKKHSTTSTSKKVRPKKKVNK